MWASGSEASTADRESFHEALFANIGYCKRSQVENQRSTILAKQLIIIAEILIETFKNFEDHTIFQPNCNFFLCLTSSILSQSCYSDIDIYFLGDEGTN